MKYGVYLPTFGAFADAALLAGWAADAEAAGWDGVFVWDHMAMWWDRSVPVVDSWVALTLIAAATQTVRIGALVTPLARRRPWKYARETTEVDRLSGGRLIAGVGLGANVHEFEAFGEPEGLPKRAAMLDEALEVVTGLWSGQPFSYHGDHYRVDGAHFLPTPVQRPRVPVWVAGSWPNRAPYRRAARWDGALCTVTPEGPFNVPVDAVAAIRDLVAEERGSVEGFDLALVNGNPEWHLDHDAGEVASYKPAGLTWWLEDVTPGRFGWDGSSTWPVERMEERITAGPPRS